MIPCLSWIARGVADEDPLVLELGANEIADLIATTQKNLEISEGQGSEDEGNDEMVESKGGGGEGNDDDDMKEFNMDDYDKEEGDVQKNMLGAGLSGIAYYTDPKNDPYITLPEAVNDEDEKEDYKVRLADNLICCSKIEEDLSTLEVHIWNQDEEDFYVHHDILLDTLPVSLAWTNFDVGYTVEDGVPRAKGNYVIVGSMTPQIEIWDLDIINTSEPVGFLGERRKPSKKKPKVGKKGHSDAVMSLAWNHHTETVLASGSADHHVLLWDLEHQTAKECLTTHKNKVQSLAWHLAEPTTLLSGGYDAACAVTDCRTGSSRTWMLDDEIQQVIWSTGSPFVFLAATQSGNIYGVDIRNADKTLYTIAAHDDEVAGLALTRNIPGLLASCGGDEIVKIWDISGDKPSFVISKEFSDNGALNCLSFCPDYDTMLAVGGIKGGLAIWDPAVNKTFRTHFNIPDQ